jgi:rhamnose utilization protein RhaD (predicted bifunctional aldolase and dehydrogenase)
MSAGDIERIMMLANCSEEDAKNAYEKTHDVIEACDLLLQVPETKGAPKKNTKVESELFSKMRKDMKEMDDKFTRLNQPLSSSQVLSHTHAPAQEEMTLHSDCTQSSHLATLAEEEQRRETAYPLQ